MKSNYVTRIRIISFFIFLFSILLIGRLYLLQVVRSEVYLEKADRQYSSSSKNIFNRGTVFFQNKDGSLVSAATLQSGFTVAVNPNILKDPEMVYQKLSQFLELNYDQFISKVTKENDPYEEIANRVPVEIGQRIDQLDITGLNVYKDRWRFYPGGDLASSIIGIMGYKGDEYAGRYGLERQYEGELQRNEGPFRNFFAEIFSDIKKVTSKSGEIEADIVTTLEPTLELHLQNLLKEISQKWTSESSGGIIMNPKNGEIYAMATFPSFDSNHPEFENDILIFSNPLIENRYEMGSVIKPITIAAGIDAGVITPNTTYYDRGYLVINNNRVSNFDSKERGVVGMQEVLSQSLNVGAAYVQSLLGNKSFSEYMKSFGVTEKTGIDLPNEGRNLTANLDSTVDIDLATAAFGQGIAFTPITTIRALSVMANGGVLITPHIVKRINYKIGISKETALFEGKRVIKKETAEDLTRMMVHSVDKVLMAGTLKIPQHSIAIKTGTAQMARSDGGGYYDDRFLHSFVGYFPAYDPEFIIFLYTINPKGARFGSETLSEPFFDITKFLINYYEVVPDR